MVLFLRNWIRSGVNKVRDLSFVDGKLDVDRMYEKIVHKRNTYDSPPSRVKMSMTSCIMSP